MNRFFNCNGIVLRQRTFGESNREGFFLTPDFGILRCTVYGGPKSKLRSFVSAFHSGILYAYHDPVRDSYKVQDFDVKAWRMGLRENYERTMTAIALCETVLAGHGGAGNWQDAYTLTTKSLDAMENTCEDMTKRIFVHFLWNWAHLLGVVPDFADKQVPFLNSDAMNWLKFTKDIDPALLVYQGDELKQSIDTIGTTCTIDIIEAAKNYCFRILENSFGYAVKSWTW